MPITRPMLAASCKDVSAIKYPVYCTTKIDGIRSLIAITDGLAVSRTFKPFRNEGLNSIINQLQLPVGVDFEITDGSGNFQSAVTAAMCESAQCFYELNIFDYVKSDLSREYLDRMKDLKELEPVLMQRLAESSFATDVRLNFLYPKKVENEEELLAYEAECLANGYEGVMMRSGSGPYKCGRSTFREGYLVKLKRFVDSEIVVTDLEAWTTNTNPQTRDAFGLAERSTSKANLVEQNWLGTIVGTDVSTGVVVRIGSGLTMAERQYYWEHKDELLNKYVTYKYFPHGIKELPRHPVFKGVRPDEDVVIDE